MLEGWGLVSVGGLGTSKCGRGGESVLGQALLTPLPVPTPRPPAMQTSCTQPGHFGQGDQPSPWSQWDWDVGT